MFAQQSKAGRQELGFQEADARLAGPRFGPVLVGPHP